MSVKLLLPDKTVGFELARTSFNGVGEDFRILARLGASGAVKRLVGFGMVHSDRQRRF